jgi:hypothetical protein
MPAKRAVLDLQEAPMTDVVPLAPSITPVEPLELSAPCVADLAGAARLVQGTQEALGSIQECCCDDDSVLYVLVG